MGTTAVAEQSRVMDLKSRDWDLVATKIEEIEYTCGWVGNVGYRDSGIWGRRAPKIATPYPTKSSG